MASLEVRLAPQETVYCQNQTTYDSFYIVGAGTLMAKGSGGTFFGGGKQEFQLSAGQFLCEQGLDAIAEKHESDTSAIDLCLPGEDATVKFPSHFTASAKDSEGRYHYG